jgi:hypothetical protein
MAKRTTKIKEPSDTALVQWAETAVQTGTPSMVLMPARNYCFRVLDDKHKITIPRKGTYHDMDSGYFSEHDGEFNLLDSDSETMYVPSLSKILFAAKKYPNLQLNQMFAPIALIFRDDEVDILGQVIELLDPKDIEDLDDESIKSSVRA